MNQFRMSKLDGGSLVANDFSERSDACCWNIVGEV